MVIEAGRLCMIMRGVEKQHFPTVTTSILGAFRVCVCAAPTADVLMAIG